MEDSRINEIVITGIIWIIVQLLLIPASLWSPISNIITEHIYYKNFFILLINLPGLVVIFAGLILFFLGQTKFLADSVEYVLIFLVFYCLLIILFTGGISNSPFISMLAIVPLITGPYIRKDIRLRTLWSYFAGVIVITILSEFNIFNPPIKYPAQWPLSGLYSNYIIAAILLLSIVLEIILVVVKSKNINYSLLGSISQPTSV